MLMPLSLRSLTFAELPLSVCSFGRSFVEGVMNTVLMRPRALRALAFWVPERTPRPILGFSAMLFERHLERPMCVAQLQCGRRASRPCRDFDLPGHGMRWAHSCCTNRRELRLGQLHIQI